jgi:hypothetical protein
MITKIDKVDKREHYSPADEAYILYRQNQFQLDVDVTGPLQTYSSNPPTPIPTSSPDSPPVPPQSPVYVNIGDGQLTPVEYLYFHIYAVKQHKGHPLSPTEEVESLVDLVQLGGPRNRKEFQLPGLCPIVVGRATYSRLQFRAATPNNARVHPDQPNPNQQYYRIVLSLVAKTANSLHFIFSKISPCLVVRGQNPGKFQGHSKILPPPPATPTTELKQEYPPSVYAFTPGTPGSVNGHFSANSSNIHNIVKKPLPPIPPIPPYMVADDSAHAAAVTDPYLSSSSSSYTHQQTNIVTTYNATTTTYQQQQGTPSIGSPAPRGTKRQSPSQPLLPKGASGGPGGGEGWQRDYSNGAMYTANKVGINTASPQEALHVHGNVSLCTYSSVHLSFLLSLRSSVESTIQYHSSLPSQTTSV